MSIRKQLVRYYHWLRQYGYNDSHSGNASVRQAKTIWVTPTGACADSLKVGDLVKCDLQGSIGDKASLDAPLHLAIYQRNPEANAVLHSHGAYTIALTLDGQALHPVDFEGQYYFPTVPVLTIAYHDYVTKAPAEIAAVLTEYPIAVIRGHGVYAWGRSLNLAYKWTCSLEQSAKIQWLASFCGKNGPMPG